MRLFNKCTSLTKVSFSTILFMVILPALLNKENTFAQQPDCEPVWINGVMGRCTGYSMISKDVDDDGRAEIICGGIIDYYNYANIWYVLKYNPILQSYDQVWLSSFYESGESISLIDAMDVDGDGETEIVIGTYSGLVQFFNGVTRQVEGQIQLHDNPQKVLLADADNDNTTDLVISTFHNTYLYEPGNSEPKFIIPYGDLDLECGNVDAEPSVELVYAPGKVIRVINGNIMVVWEINYPPLGMVDLTDVDSDGILEIIFAESHDDVHIYDADLKQHKYAIETSSFYYSFSVADVNTDGINEILISQSDGAWGGIYCYNASTTEEMWRVYNPEYGSMNMNVANTDMDNAPELVWAGECKLSGYSDLFIFDIDKHSMDWKSDYDPAPYNSIEFHNLAGDETKELVMLSNRYDGGGGKTRLSVYNTMDHSLVWIWDSTFSNTGYCGFQIQDIDNDEKVEIILAGGSLNSEGYIAVMDPVNQTVKTSHIFNNLLNLYSIGIDDIDNDGTKEYIVSTKSNIHIVNSFDYSIEWSSEEFFSFVYDTAKLIIGNIDSDSNPEILFLKGSLLCIDGLTHQSWETQEKNLRSFCLFDIDENNIDEIIAGTTDGRICIINGSTRMLTWLPINMAGSINAIAISNITGSETPEIIFTSGGLAHFSDLMGNMISTSKIGDIKGDHDFIRIIDNNYSTYKNILFVTSYQTVEYDYDCFRTVGIQAGVRMDEWNIYPNPSGNIIYIESYNDFSLKSATLEVLSAQGVLLISEKIHENRCSVNISDLAKGLYIVKIRKDGFQKVEKIVKE